MSLINQYINCIKNNNNKSNKIIFIKILYKICLKMLSKKLNENYIKNVSEI